jgi:hypothetical protein
MSMRNLGLRTQILESLEWNEESLEEAFDRTYDVVQDLIDEGVTPYEARARAVRVLSSEYPVKVAQDLVEYIILESVTPPNPVPEA